MISYCKEDHLKTDYLNHKALCLAIQLIAKRRGKKKIFIVKLFNKVIKFNYRWTCVSYVETLESFRTKKFKSLYNFYLRTISESKFATI